MSDPLSVSVVERYLDALWMEKGLADNTLSSYRRDLLAFARWLDGRGGPALEQVTREDLQAYLATLLERRRSPRTVARCLSCLRGFYRHLLRAGVTLEDPTLDLDSPRQGRPLPKSLSEDDVDRLLGAPDTGARYWHSLDCSRAARTADRPPAMPPPRRLVRRPL